MIDTITLHGFSVSPHVRTARIAFQEKGLPVTFNEVGLDHLATAGYRAINPFGKMPSLTHGAVTLYETPALLVYANGIGSGPSLEPSDPAARARMFQYIGIAQNYMYPAGVMQLYFHNVLAGLFGMEPNPDIAAAAVAPVTQQLDVLASGLDRGFLAGGGFSLADIYCGVMVDYIARTRDGRALVKARPALQGWLDALRARDSFTSTLAPMLVNTDQT